VDFSPRGRARSKLKGRMMEKVLEKKVIRKVAPKVDPSLAAIERLTVLNGTLVEQVKTLSSDLDNLKDRVAQVASRLGL